MNKTISINIGGIIFHIEENGYEKLKQYLDNIRKHFSASEGKDEIVADIEARIGEMFQERIKGKREAVVLADVEEVIGIMGKPEDFGADAKENASAETNQGSQGSSANYGKKRFYRNPDDKVLGGVCSGVAAYFDFDPLWLRLAFALSFFIWGTGLLFYIILWIIIPKANTAAEKLEMKGEKVNISNIEKSIKEEFESVKKKYENIDTSSAKNFFEKAVDFVVSLFGMFFKAIIKIIAAIFVFIGVLILIAMLLGLLGAFGVASVALPALAMIFASQTLLVFAFIGAILFVGMPIIALIYHGIRIIFKIKKTHNGFKWGMGTLWILGLLILIFVGAKMATEFSSRQSARENISIQQPSIDTLYLGIMDGNSEEEEEESGFWALRKSMIVIDNVHLDIVRSNSDNFELEKIQYASGGDKKEAKETARKMNYALQQKDSVILFSEVISFDNMKWRNQEVKLLLKVPVGKTVYLRHDIENLIYDIKNVTDTYDGDMVGHYWMMRDDGLTCLDCSGDERTVTSSSVGFGDTKTFDAKDFTKINLGGAFKVTISQGKNFEVTARGKQKDLKHLKAKVRSKELEIETDRHFWDYIKSSRTPEIFITMPNLERVELSGATSAKIEGFKGDKIIFDLSGANKTDFEGDYDEISIDASGAAEITLDGKNDKLKIDLSGACSLDAENMKSKEVEVDLSGACSAKVYASEKISGDVSTGSSLKYRGNPNKITIDSQFSSVKKEE